MEKELVDLGHKLFLKHLSMEKYRISLENRFWSFFAKPSETLRTHVCHTMQNAYRVIYDPIRRKKCVFL